MDFEFDHTAEQKSAQREEWDQKERRQNDGRRSSDIPFKRFVVQPTEDYEKLNFFPVKP